MKRLCPLLLALTLSAASPPPPTHPGQMLYFMKNGRKQVAIDAYKAYSKSLGEHQFELLHEMAWSIIEEGIKSDDAEVQLLSLFGASLSQDEEALQILTEALRKPNPEIQLAAIKFLAQMNHDEADLEIGVGMGSNELLIRLETLMLMAEKRMPKTYLQAESLMSKIPKQLYLLFPQIFAACGDSYSLKQLRRFLSDPDDHVRAAAIHSVEQTKREEFLPQVRRLSKQVNPLIQEAAASCLGALSDEGAREHLVRLSNSQTLEVRTTALKSLWHLGDRTVGVKIYEEAKGGNPYALNLLGQVDGYEDFLAHNLGHADPLVRLNAATALLERKDPRCLKVLTPYLIDENSSLEILPQVSPAKGLLYWRLASTFSDKEDDPKSALMQEVALRVQESFLALILDLPETHFLQLADTLLNKNVKPLLPALVQLLERCRSDRAIDLLKKYETKPGAPYVRQLCTLGLYRLGTEGPYAEAIQNFMHQSNGADLIRFRPLIYSSQDPLEATYQLTPEETSRIFVESLESLVQKQDPLVIDTLLDLIQNGNEKNRYALAGVLIRATL